MTMLLLITAGTLAAIDFAGDWGPFYSRDRTPANEERCRALGPFWETRNGENGDNLLALRPLFSREHDVYQRRTVRDFMWPVWTGKLSYERSSQWRCLLLMTWRNDDIYDPESRHAFQILPVYFQGRADDGESYFAVFPLGGRIRNFLFYDEVRFTLFPLYSRARVNDLTTTSWLWPIFSRTVGGDTERHNIFPFYGYSRRRDDFEKRFILWPFWTSARYNYSGASGFGYVFFPFWGHVRLEDQESWMLLPPFFRYSTGATLNQMHTPWPFIQLSRGEVEQTYFWPLWGKKSGHGFRHDFFIWPLCMRFRHFTAHDDRVRFWVLPFAYFT
ncbi:MAG: hypothetical protein LC657_02335, partial [Desulfobacteraceae bacterium]|nr:hypothetical protein [Desulfobacteraceae bacterium]